jgi:hypothetical protein
MARLRRQALNRGTRVAAAQPREKPIARSPRGAEPCPETPSLARSRPYRLNDQNPCGKVQNVRPDGSAERHACGVTGGRHSQPNAPDPENRVGSLESRSSIADGGRAFRKILQVYHLDDCVEEVSAQTGPPHLVPANCLGKLLGGRLPELNGFHRRIRGRAAGAAFRAVSRNTAEARHQVRRFRER